MKHMKLFIWDFDGTLVDSYRYSASCMQRAIRDFGYDATEEQLMEQMLDTIPATLQYAGKGGDHGSVCGVGYKRTGSTRLVLPEICYNLP